MIVKVSAWKVALRRSLPNNRRQARNAEIPDRTSHRGLLSACSTTHSPGPQTEPEPGSASVDSQLDKPGREISRGLSQPNNVRIAVLEFNDLNGNVSDLGKFLAEEMTTRLFKHGS